MHSSDVQHLTRTHYAALRAWLQGMPVELISGRWLASDPDEIPDRRTALDTLHAIRDAITQRAELHGRPDLAACVSEPGRSGKAMDRAVDAVRELERLGTPAPQPMHGVHLWMAGPLARRLQRADIATLGQLVTLCNQRGRSWWRHVPRIGPLAATRITAFLDKHATSIGQLGAHVTGAALTVPAVPATLEAGHGTAVPLEVMRLPRDLNGASGRNRAPKDRCVIAAQDDYQAVQTWLSLWPADSATFRAYRKEAERFLAWIIIERGKALSDAFTDDCIAYRSFLENPAPAARWCGPPVPRAIQVGGLPMANPAWRPFKGPMAARSRAQAETVLSSLCAWLTGRQYLSSNPWDGMPAIRVPPAQLPTEKAIAPAVNDAFLHWLEAQSPLRARARLWRAAVLLLQDTGARCAEAAGCRRADLAAAAPEGAPLREVWGEMRVVGKRSKLRHVPVSRRLWEALNAHWADLDPSNTDAALLSPLPGDPLPPRARAKALEAGHGYSDRGLRRLIEQAVEAFALEICDSNPDLHAELRHIHPHAFRHSFGSNGPARGMQLEVVRDILGHASIATTSLYSTTWRDQRLREVDKLYDYKPS